jgi:hypothetical protein
MDVGDVLVTLKNLQKVYRVKVVGAKNRFSYFSPHTDAIFIVLSKRP